MCYLNFWLWRNPPGAWLKYELLGHFRKRHLLTLSWLPKGGFEQINQIVPLWPENWYFQLSQDTSKVGVKFSVEKSRIYTCRMSSAFYCRMCFGFGRCQILPNRSKQTFQRSNPQELTSSLTCSRFSLNLLDWYQIIWRVSPVDRLSYPCLCDGVGNDIDLIFYILHIISLEIFHWKDNLEVWYVLVFLKRLTKSFSRHQGTPQKI